MEYIKAKSILYQVKNPENWFDKKYNMNIYRGCNHGCIYCDSRSSCYQISNFDEIAVKENAIDLLKKEIKLKRVKGVIGLGAMSDSYNSYEKDLMYTRKALEVISEYHFGLHIPTKSILVVRDSDIIKRINAYSPVTIAITITTYEDELSSKIEPAAPLSSKRFEAVRALSEEGIYTGLLMMPILPFLTDTEDNITQIIRKASKCGAKFIYPWIGVSMRQGQREYFYRAADIIYPGLKGKYITTFGDRYECNSPDIRNLWSIFCSECDRLGIKYKMKDIIEDAIEHVPQKQLSLF